MVQVISISFPWLTEKNISPAEISIQKSGIRGVCCVDESRDESLAKRGVRGGGSALCEAGRWSAAIGFS